MCVVCFFSLPEASRNAWLDCFGSGAEEVSGYVIIERLLLPGLLAKGKLDKSRVAVEVILTTEGQAGGKWHYRNRRSSVVWAGDHSCWPVSFRLAVAH